MIYVYGGVILPAFTTTDTLLRYDPVANSWANLGSAGTGGTRQLRRDLAVRHGPIADHRRCGPPGVIDHRDPHLHDQQRYVHHRPVDARQPGRTRPGHPARWPGAGRGRLQHGDHRDEYRGIAKQRHLCGCNPVTVADAKCIADAKYIAITVTFTVSIAIAVSDVIQRCYHDG